MVVTVVCSLMASIVWWPELCCLYVMDEPPNASAFCCASEPWSLCSTAFVDVVHASRLPDFRLEVLCRIHPDTSQKWLICYLAHCHARKGCHDRRVGEALDMTQLLAVRGGTVAMRDASGHLVDGGLDDHKLISLLYMPPIQIG